MRAPCGLRLRAAACAPTTPTRLNGKKAKQKSRDLNVENENWASITHHTNNAAQANHNNITTYTVNGNMIK